MRLLLVNTEKSWRGGERQTLYNLMGFAQEGVDVTVLCREKSPLAGHTHTLGIKTIEIRTPLQAMGWLATRARHFDLIHAQTANAQTYAVLTKPFHGKPVVYTRRVDFALKGFGARFKYHFTDAIVAISESVKTTLGNFGLQAVTVIPDTVVPRELDAERARVLVEPYAAHGKQVIATIGALDDDKDPFTMLEAVKCLSLTRNDFVFFHFGEGPLFGKMKKRIEHLQLQQFYCLMGFVPNVEDMFAVLKVFCMSSRHEGLGSSVLDAFVYKVPVVATAVGGLVETVSGRGLLCDAQDSACLSQKIGLLLDHPDIRDKTTDCAYAYVMQKHSQKTTARQYLQLFCSILDSAKGLT